MADLLTFAEFAKTGIVKLRKDNFKGIHNVYSGFNEAARNYFGWTKERLIEETNKLVTDGVIEIRSTKEGFTLYLLGEKPTNGNSAGDVLAKMGL